MALASPQLSQGAGITVAATLIEPAEPNSAEVLTVRLDLDTHSGDLMRYDLTQLAVLRTSEGITVTDGFTWQGKGETSHHRSGFLQVEVVRDGMPLISATTSYLELELNDIGVPSRRFRWEGTELTRLQPTPVPVAEAHIYLPAIAEGSVVALDPSTLEVAWRLQVSDGNETRGPESAMGIAVSPDGRTIYTGDVATRELVVVDVATQEITVRLPLVHGIHAIDLSPDGQYLWVDGGLDDYSWLSATTVIDTQSLEVIRTLSPGLGVAAHLSFTPDGQQVWAASVTTNLVWVWDAATGAVLDAIPLTGAPLRGATPEGQAGLLGFNEVAISPDGTRAYAVGPEAATVFVIEVASRQLLGSVPAGERAHGIAVTPDGREVWTANRSGSVTIIDATTLEVLDTLEVAPYANHVAFDDAGRAFVSRQDDVAVIEVVSRTIIAEIAVGSEPHEFSLKGVSSPNRHALAGE
jgi:DNA-binding beta-propeller fold protein YncE